LFQHNVEFMIFRRLTQNARDPLRRSYLAMQADRMFAYEKRACSESGHVVACSQADAKLMQDSFGIPHVSHVPTGVNIEFFAPPPETQSLTSKPDLVFLGSMDWLANEQGVLWFAQEILPLIRRRRPKTTFAIVGRTPPPVVNALAAKDSLITVTGTVADVRPWLWEARVSVVPLLAGGGTRLKIYESMAARTPVVSTTIGAEGLECTNGEDIRIADTPETFAGHCLDLLENEAERQRMVSAAWEMVNANCSWEKISRRFDEILQSGPRLP